MFENIRLSFQGIWSHKLRSFLTMLGIIIGIAAIIAIVSTIEGTNELIKQNMMGNNRHTVKVQLSQDDYTYEISTWNPSPEGVPLFDEDTRQEILQIPNVLRAAFYQVRSEYNSVVFYNNQSLSSCTVLGIDQYYFGTAGYQIMQGREIIQEDSKKKRQVAVIDEAVLRTLFPDEDPIGKTIEIYGEPFTVVGVCTQVGQSELVINSEEEYWTYYQGGSSSGNIYIPKGVWGTIYKFDEAQNLVLQASGADEMAAAGKAAANIMNQNMNVSDSSITYRSEDLMQQAKQLQDMQSSTNSMLIWVACISLLVGGNWCHEYHACICYGAHKGDWFKEGNRSQKGQNPRTVFNRGGNTYQYGWFARCSSRNRTGRGDFEDVIYTSCNQWYIHRSISWIFYIDWSCLWFTAIHLSGKSKPN